MRGRAATWSLVLGLLSLFCGVLAPFAIWAGVHALRERRREPGRGGGGTLAVFGLASGSIALAFAVSGIAYWVVAS